MSAIRRRERAGEWYVDFRYCGRRFRKKSPVQTRIGTEAFERVLRKRLLEMEERGVAPFRMNDVIFVNFADRWMKDYVLVKNRPSVVDSKLGILRRYLVPAFGNLPLHGITPERIDRLAASMKASRKSPKTINNALSVLRTCLGSAVRWNLLANVPSMNTLPVPEIGYRYLSSDEAQRLVEAARPGFWRAFIVFLLHTGCRFGEAAAVRWDDLELEGASPRVRIERSAYKGCVGPTKNGKCRDIPLTPDAIRELSALPSENTYVFVLPGGQLPRSSSSSKHLKKICERAGVKRVSWHVMRHSFATELSARRVPLRVIQELLGHSSIAMTCRYAHVADRTMKEAVAELPRFS